MDVAEHKCIGCSATLPFNPKTQKWDCEYCGRSYTLEELDAYEAMQNQKKEKVSSKDMDLYRCPSCGAEVVADDTTSATFCVYCGNTNILKDRLQEEFAPKYIIPFKNTKVDAKAAFKKCTKGKIFAPKEFSDLNNIEKIYGVYIPFWLYDTKVQASLSGTGKDIKSWSSGDYRYTKTDTYSIARKANMEYERVPVDGAKKFADDIMQSIEPFVYTDLEPFNMSYISGFLAEKYDVTEDEAYKVAEERIKNTALEKLKTTGRIYTSMNVMSHEENVEKQNTDYTLLPVWMLNIKYKNKMYPFAMNGQTGKLIGDIPISISKMITFYFILVAILTAIIAIFIYIF